MHVLVSKLVYIYIQLINYQVQISNELVQYSNLYTYAAFCSIFFTFVFSWAMEESYLLRKSKADSFPDSGFESLPECDFDDSTAVLWTLSVRLSVGVSDWTCSAFPFCFCDVFCWPRTHSEPTITVSSGKLPELSLVTGMNTCSFKNKLSLDHSLLSRLICSTWKKKTKKKHDYSSKTSLVPQVWRHLCWLHFVLWFTLGTMSIPYFINGNGHKFIRESNSLPLNLNISCKRM